MYKNISILAWDPSNYTSTLYQWYQHPDFNLFPEYKRFMRRNPNADFHILNPRSLWEIWDFIQSNSPYRLRRNPPSSGFLGIYKFNKTNICSYMMKLKYFRFSHFTTILFVCGCF